MAPEQITNYRDAKRPVDQYATGATLNNLLTGHFLYDFEGSKKHQLKMILEDKPVPIQSRRKDIPDGLAAVIHQALAREPEHRFTDAKSMRKALLPFFAETSERRFAGRSFSIVTHAMDVTV